MKKIISFVLTCVLLVNCFAFTALLAEAEDNPGFFPGWDTKYKLEQDLSYAPKTFTAVVEFPVEYNTAAANGGPGLGGTIIGNFDATPGTVRFSVDHGFPCLTWRDSYNRVNVSDDVTLTAKFDGIPVVNGVYPMYTGEPVVLTIVRDDANQNVRCYIDGVLKQTINYSALVQVPSYLNNRGDESKCSNFVIGGDMAFLNRNYIRALNGNQVSLNKIGLFADARTDDQVLADYNDIISGKVPESSFAFFDFAGYPDSPETITAVKGNYTSKKLVRYLADKNDLDGQDYAFSIAFVGDTQMLTRYAANIDGNNPDGVNNLKYIYQWLNENKEEEKIEYVIGLGDITDTAKAAEWDIAVPLINGLGDKYGTNYIAIMGNHDEKIAGAYGSAFAGTAYANSITDRYDQNSILNFYKKVNLNGVPFMFLCLEYAANDDILAWANKVVDANPQYNVIYITHGYLAKDGTTLGRDDGSTPDGAYVLPDGTYGTILDYDGSNNGEEQWHKFVKNHENICMVVSGHIGNDEILVTDAVGDKGNTVKQVLIDHQDIDEHLVKNNVTDNPKGLGVVSMMYFMGDGKTVKTDAISTVRAYSDNKTFYSKPYFDEANRQTFELDLRGTKGGDFTGNDGRCTLADLIYVIDEALNNRGKACDVNADGKVNLVDVLRVASYING